MSLSKSALTGVLILALFAQGAMPAAACPFCSAVSQTLRQEIEVMDAVVIAVSLDSDLTRDKANGDVRMRVVKVLKGGDLVKVDQEVTATYYGDVVAGRRFMLSGVDPPELMWSCLPVSERAEKYIVEMNAIGEGKDLARLRFVHDYLEDEESMLSRDAYDEFAITDYTVIRELGPEMDREQLIAWISEEEMSADRKRLYLTMLGVCGSRDDLPFLAGLLRSETKSSRSGLDALIACYLTLAGEEGLELVNELFLANKKAPYAETYAAIMAVRFHGTEGDVIARSALLPSLHHVLSRKDLADLVIPDLARWQDWSQIDRVTDLFIESDADNNWVRVPIVNYLRACPLPAADKAIEKLEKIDPASVKRANTFFTIPQPAKEKNPATSRWKSPASRRTAARVSEPTSPAFRAKTSVAQARPGRSLQARAPYAAKTSSARYRGGDPITAKAYAAREIVAGALAGEGLGRGASLIAKRSPVTGLNPLRLLYVVSLGMATVMIAQYLLLSGGSAAGGSRKSH